MVWLHHGEVRRFASLVVALPRILVTASSIARDTEQSIVVMRAPRCYVHVSNEAAVAKSYPYHYREHAKAALRLMHGVCCASLGLPRSRCCAVMYHMTRAPKSRGHQVLCIAITLIHHGVTCVSRLHSHRLHQKPHKPSLAPAALQDARDVSSMISAFGKRAVGRLSTVPCCRLLWQRL